METLITISPGRITALWIVLRTASKYDEITFSDLFSIAKNTSLRGGGLPIDDGIKIGIAVGFLVLQNDVIKIHSSGQKIVLSWDGEEPNQLILRELLLHLVLKLKPSWLTFTCKSIEERILAIPNEWLEVLENAELIRQPLSNEAIEWWKLIQQKVEEIDEDFKSTVGEIGEYLSIKFEKLRLIRDKFHLLADGIKWISKESDAYGYDISSFFGNLNFSKSNTNDEIFIEVKSSVTSSKIKFYFILTRNEWDTAEANIEKYFFHLWKNVKILTKGSSGEGPLIISAKTIKKLVPKDQSENCNWLKCRIEIDFNKLNKDIYDPNEILPL